MHEGEALQRLVLRKRVGNSCAAGFVFLTDQSNGLLYFFNGLLCLRQICKQIPTRLCNGMICPDAQPPSVTGVGAARAEPAVREREVPQRRVASKE